MANIQTLQEKVQKAQEKVAKCEGTIVRHQKSLDKKIKAGVDAYEIKWKEEDIEGATRKLNDAVQILENWKAKLNLEIEKERFLEGNAPQVIKDFLEEWKRMAFEWHVNRYDEFIKLIRKLKKEAEEMKVEYVKTNRQDDIKHYMDEYNEDEEVAIQSVLRWKRLSALDLLLKENKLNYDGIAKRTSNFAGATVLQMSTIRDKEERLAWLEKDLEADKKAKMLDLINRINAVVGTITDAKHLKISNVGNLNGYIIGETGKAEIETVGAGGWNIQCFHYRTLIKPIK